MALWGNRDLVGQAGSVTINLSTGAITGSGTTFNTAGFEVQQGDVIVVGTGATYGHAVIQSVSSNTAASVATTQYLIGDGAAGIPLGTTYIITQQPISSIEDPNYQAPDVEGGVTASVFGVDVTETEVARAASGAARNFKPAHAGWVGVTTYTDMHGNARVKTETLVAGSMIIDDAEDANYPDS